MPRRQRVLVAVAKGVCAQLQILAAQHGGVGDGAQGQNDGAFFQARDFVFEIGIASSDFQWQWFVLGW